MNALLLLLGGAGERFGGKEPKQFLELDYEGERVPLFEIAARKLLSALSIHILVLVFPKNAHNTSVVDAAIDRLSAAFPDCAMQHAGSGASRFASFLNGLAVAERVKGLKRLVVHDANRPYLTADFLSRVEAHLGYLSPDLPAFIPVLPVVDSVVRLDGKNVVSYENREELKRVQTPQLLHYEAFSTAHAAAMGRGHMAFDYTDEGSFCLSLGLTVGSFAGDAQNTKITFPADLDVSKL